MSISQSRVSKDLFPARIQNLNLFSTYVSIIEPSNKFLNYLIDIDLILNKLRDSPKSDFSTKSVVNGWRIENPHLLVDFKLVHLHLKAVLGNLPLLAKITGQNKKFTLSSWLNVHEDAGFNKPHHHGASFLSGVVYLAVPEGSGDLRLKDPRAGKYYASQFYDDSSTEIRVKPLQGMTIIFPGFLEHYTEASVYKSLSSRRVSIAFNLDLVK